MAIGAPFTPGTDHVDGSPGIVNSGCQGEEESEEKERSHGTRGYLGPPLELYL